MQYEHPVVGFPVDDVGLQSDVFIDQSIDADNWINFVSDQLQGKF